MTNEIKEILDKLKEAAIWYDDSKLLLDYITNLLEENIKLKELCDKYEEEHKTTFEEWKKDIKIINKLQEWLEENYMCEVLTKLNELKEMNKV